MHHLLRRRLRRRLAVLRRGRVGALALRRRYPVYRGWGVVKPSCEDTLALVKELPLPTFDAGPRCKDLDQMEREG